MNALLGLALGAAGSSIDLVEALPDFRRDALAKVDLPGAVELDEHDRLHGRALGGDPNSGYAVLHRDLELLFGGDELTEYEPAQCLIMLALPIGEATSKQIGLQELETLARSEAPTRLFL